MSINEAPRFLVSPKPPIVHDELLHIGAGLRFSQSPTDYLSELRRQYGDTFLVDVFGYKLFCVFSPEGLNSLYAAAEDEASFGMATFDMLGFKTPVEVFMDADIDLFYELLTPPKVAAYVAQFHAEIERVLDDWGTEGQLNVFDGIRTLEQRVGFRVWMCEEAAEPQVWPTLKAQLDVLSQENAFVNPQQTLETLTSGKAKEKAAIAEIMAMISDMLERRKASNQWPEDNLTFLYERFKTDDAQETARKVTHNAINANQGFLSNLYAALAWCLVHLQSDDGLREQLAEEIAQTRLQYGTKLHESQEALDSMRFCEQILMESVRVAQRSITLRKVMKEIDFDCGETTYTLQPGVYVTTMLSVMNTRTPELARFDAAHYSGKKIRPDLIADGRETISTFGHGKHACPAQKFSHNMCKVLLIALLDRFEFSAIDEAIGPSVSQMGGVARAAQDVVLQYKIKR
ncbi:MAG: cytochrome P450 [Halioglobus sp.]